jgi:hypothetical protein
MLFKLVATAVLLAPLAHSQTRWSEQHANDWYRSKPWLVGANYIPSDAINQFEMFQAATWNPAINDRELALGESIGMNTMRVFLQDQLYQQDSAGFLQRLDAFLAIAARHHIRPILVLFDSCWDPNPILGPQHMPIPGVHNSGWVQSPGIPRLMNPAVEPQLKAYVQAVLSRFANDDRILAWDLWNEPDNLNGSRGTEPKEKVTRVLALLPQVFAWAREKNPKQPLTSGVWAGDWSDPTKESPMTKLQLAQSDIITFHNYGWPEQFAARVDELALLHRPILCTEYMARGAGSTFDTTLPIAKARNVAVINWGLVNGKTQTHLPWDSWERPYTLQQPPVWFHDIFLTDGTPYRPAEVMQIKSLTGH